MATFVIYEDQENVGHNFKTKETVSQKREALGLLSTNCNVRLSKASVLESVKKENGTSTICKENYTEIFEKVKSETNALEYYPSRLPLTDVDIDKCTVQVTNGSSSTTSFESPMTIDVLPVVVPLVEVVISSKDVLNTDYIVYKDDIYAYLRQIELRHKPKAYYMRRQPDVTYSMRSILVDWLVEVGEEYHLHTETLFMAVQFIDRFLSCMAVVRAKLQLLGTSAMFLASKFEEIYPPDVGEFAFITNDTYSKKQVLRMEHLILKVLDFDLSNPTSYTFVIHICVTARLPERIMFLAAYICELSLLEGDPYLEFNPSLIASSAIALARHCLGYIDKWPTYLFNQTGYNLLQLAPVLAHLNKTHAKAYKLEQGPIKEKYNATKYHQVSQVLPKRLVIRE